MNFEELIDVTIGERIKDFRIQSNMTQEQFCDNYYTKMSIDKYALSMLENGIKDNKKNPHFLTEDSISILSNDMGRTKSEFLFGNAQERKIIIKLIILNIFMNNDTHSDFQTLIPIFFKQRIRRENIRKLVGKSPLDLHSKIHNLHKKISQFELKSLANPESYVTSYRITIPIVGGEYSDSDFYLNAAFNILSNENLENAHKDPIYKLAVNSFNSLPTSKKSARKIKRKIIDKLKKYDSFFYNDKFANLYFTLLDGDSAEFSKQSSLILRCLLGNYDFAKWFFDKCDRYENWETNSPRTIKLRKKGLTSFYIDNYYSDASMTRNCYSEFAIDCKESGFPKFVKAFNEFFELYYNQFLNFFNENIFENKNMFNIKKDNPLKVLTNRTVNYIFIDNDYDHSNKNNKFVQLLKKILSEDQDNPNRTGHNFSQEMIYKFDLIEQVSNKFFDEKTKNYKLPSKIDDQTYTLEKSLDAFLELFNSYFSLTYYSLDSKKNKYAIYNLSQLLEPNSMKEDKRTIKFYDDQQDELRQSISKFLAFKKS